MRRQHLTKHLLDSGNGRIVNVHYLAGKTIELRIWTFVQPGKMFSAKGDSTP